MNVREETVAIRGKHICLLRGGTGLPLLYLHDTYCYTWTSVHDRLAEHCDVVFPMHPGCAASTGFEAIDDMEGLVFHYLDVCEALHLERPVLLGASLGGWIAAEIAVRYADLLRGVILVDALGVRVPEAPAADILGLDPPQIRAVLFADPTTAPAQELIPDTPSAAVLPAILQARQVLARFAWQFPDNPKLACYLYRVRIPTLVIWGEQDGFVPTAHAHAYQQGIPGAELVVLPQCGHLPHVEQPEAFVRTVLDYLARV